MIFFTSDQHYGNNMIIEYCNRPYKNSSIMDKDLIKKHNSKITNEDTVYIIGDLTFHKREFAEKIISKLNGQKHLIMGNHDILKPFTYLELGILSVHTSLEIFTEKGNFILVHDPAISQIDRSKTFLCGHVHDLFLRQKNCINIGVDVWNMYPVSLEQISLVIKVSK